MEMLYHSVSDLVRLANEHQIPLWKVVLLADVQERQVTSARSFLLSCVFAPQRPQN